VTARGDATWTKPRSSWLQEIRDPSECEAQIFVQRLRQMEERSPMIRMVFVLFACFWRMHRDRKPQAWTLAWSRGTLS